MESTDILGNIVGGVVLLIAFGWLASFYERHASKFSWLGKVFGKIFSKSSKASNQEQGHGFLPRLMASAIVYGITIGFLLAGSLLAKWMISWFVIPTMLTPPSTFLPLAYWMFGMLMLSATSAALNTNIILSIIPACFNFGAAYLLWNQPWQVSLPAALTAIGTYGILHYRKSPPLEVQTRSGPSTSDGGQKHGGGIRNLAARPRYTFAHVSGMQELKAELIKAGISITQGNTQKNGILFHGEPGNGKTFIAEALAGELKLPFLAVSFGDMASQWVGQTTVNAMKIFDDAEAQAPCMLFMDEIDSVFIDRSKVANSDSEAPKTLNAILTRLVDIRGKGVVLVGATNFLDRLDSASIREGRFDYKIEIPCPDLEARLALLKSGLKGFNIDIETLNSVGERWEGYSVSRVRAIAAKAQESAKENGKQQLGFDDLMDALRKIQGSKGDRIPESVPAIDKLFLSEAMRKRMSNIVTRMKNIEQVERMGGTAPRGILFSGPPGTGKTLGAMSLAKSTEWAFIKTTGNALLEDSSLMDKLYRIALDIRPCLIFIDEADDVLADRQMSPLTKSVTNRLLSIMDGAGGRIKDVAFIAATNHSDDIDEAMLRGGRFTEKIEFSLPGDSVIRDYVTDWINNSKAPLDADFTAENVTVLLEGQSLANVKEILQGAINESIDRISSIKNEKVRISDLKAAVKSVNG